MELNENSLQLKFICEIKRDNFMVDVTNSVYKNCVYFNSYIYIIKKNIHKLLLFENDGLYYYDGIEYNFIIIDGEKKHNISDNHNIFINLNDNKIYLDKTFLDIDNEITNIMDNSVTIQKDEYSVCFIIALKYIRGYDSYIKVYVDNIQKFYKNSFIIIVDNNSTHLKDIEIVFYNYKNIVILTNTSDSKYEVGAQNVGLKWIIENNKNNYDYYVFTQDNFIIENKYDFNKLKYFNIQACSIVEHQEHFEWIYTDEKKYILNNCNITGEYDNINICWGCSYIIDKSKLYCLDNYIKNVCLREKKGSCMYERILGFIIKELEPIKFIVDGFLTETKYTSKTDKSIMYSFKYFKKISQNKVDNKFENNYIAVLKNNIITTI